MLYEYNQIRPSETEKRAELLKKILGDCGEGAYIEAPFYANFGGHHCHFGKLGPNVTIATAGHPILPELRRKGLQYNMPGITIGDNVVIGAGSVVTKDIPSDVVAVGNPCRIMREVGEHDRKYYFKDREINHEEWGD